ncbi:hypothetical protein ACHQM5_028293 [Ranunculus cassubicifolius]
MRKCSRDRLSYLPRTIRVHIVSFLAMKEAMRTSVLSRQWKNVCSSLSNLEFHQSDFRMQKLVDFRDFVDEILLRRDGSDIQRFCLRAHVDSLFIRPRHVNAWISFAVKHNVQHLDLGQNISECGKLPRRLFTCPTLTVLSLVYVKVEWPSTVRFPILKSLRLERMIFYHEEMINKLLSPCTCPVLAELSMIYCYLKFETLSISNIPNLKCLNLCDDNDLTVNLCLPFLREIDCHSYRPPNMQNLVSLSIGTFDFFSEFWYLPRH